MTERKVIIVIPAGLWAVSIVRHALRDFLVAKGIDDCDFISDLEVGTDEAITNVVRHVYEEDESQIISVTIGIKDDFVEIVIRDFGPPINRETLKEIKSTGLKESGRGLLLMRELIDDIEYKEVCRGNTIILRKKIP